MIVCIPEWEMYVHMYTENKRQKNEEKNIECHQDIE